MKDEQIVLFWIGIAMLGCFAMAGVNFGVAIVMLPSAALQALLVCNGCLWAAFGLIGAAEFYYNHNLLKREYNGKTHKKSRD